MPPRRLETLACTEGAVKVLFVAQFAFVEVPHLRFDLRVLGGNILNIAFVEHWLRDVFCSIMEPYTLPDKARCLLTPKGQVFDQAARQETMLRRRWLRLIKSH